MKKNQITQTSLIAMAALFVGFLLGMAFTSITPAGDKLAGTIGRVDRHRNVQITEDDIRLRNEMADNLDMRDQYVDYLNFFYIKALRTSNDVFVAMDKAAAVDAFATTFDEHTQALENYSTYLEVARTDILQAIGALVSIEDDRNRPMIELLNQANNAIHRMRNNSDILLDFMIAINTFMEQQEVFYPELADAHDLLALNSIETALVYRNKPLLSFLEKTTMQNDEEGIVKLMSELRDAANLQEFNLNDMTRLDMSQSLENSLKSEIYSQLSHITSMNMEANLSSVFSTGLQGQIQFRSGQELLRSMDAGNLSNMPSLRNMESLKNLQILQSDFRVN